MNESIFILYCFLAAQVLSGCGDSSFAGGGGTSRLPTSKPSTKGSPTDQSTEQDSSDLQKKPCPRVSQLILVIDLKSGWWAGDGANFFNKIMGSLSGACVGTVQFEYHHILEDRGEGGVFPGGLLQKQGLMQFESIFMQKDWNKYSQIWFLSGSDEDSDDLKTSDPLFKRIVSSVASSNAQLFIGAGYGSISHANKLANAVLPNVVFSTSQEEGELLHPESRGLPVKSVLTKGNQLIEHDLFNGVNTLVDEVYEEFGNASDVARSDFLSSTTSLKVIGRNSSNMSSIAVGEMSNKRRVVIDTGLQRYYGISQPNGSETLKFLQNILVYLGSP